MRVVVTDYTFPALDAEAEATRSSGAEFFAFQCKTSDDVIEAVRGATRLQQLVADDITAHLTGRPLRRPVPGSIAAKEARL